MSLVPVNGRAYPAGSPGAKVEHALAEAAVLVLEAIELDRELSVFLDRWHDNRVRLLGLGLRNPGDEFMSRELRNAVRMRAPAPFWDRDPAEPPA